ncbi:hypothetical protein ACFX2I_004926 [Malus domestica]
MEARGSSKSQTEPKKRQSKTPRKPKDSVLEQKSPAEFFAKNKNIAGFDNAWVTLGRTQLNFGEPDSAIQSFDRALAIKIVLFGIPALSFFLPGAFIEYWSIKTQKMWASECNPISNLE